MQPSNIDAIETYQSQATTIENNNSNNENVDNLNKIQIVKDRYVCIKYI